jgi:hypothetical protein
MKLDREKGNRRLDSERGERRREHGDEEGREGGWGK